MSNRTSTPVYRDGRRMRINGMAASSISKNLYDVSKCDECHQYVAWAKNKSNRWYLCTVMMYSTDAGREKIKAAPYMPHNCGEIVFELTTGSGHIVSEHKTYEDALAAKNDKVAEIKNSADTMFTFLDRSEFSADALARLDEHRKDMYISAITVSNDWKINEHRKAH